MAERVFPNSQHSINKGKDARFRAVIDRARSEDKIKKQQMAKAANISYPTFVERLKNPENITLGELRRLRNLIGISSEDLDAMV